LACGVAAAEPPCDLAHEAHRVERWDQTWGLLLSAGAIVQGAVALTPQVDDTTRRVAAVGATESLIVAAGAWILPMRIDPRGTCDQAATVERNTFRFLHIGNVLYNAAGGIVVTELTDWSHGAVSFAVGYAVGLAQIYTMPRLHSTWTTAVAPTGGGWSVSLGRAF